MGLSLQESGHSWTLSDQCGCTCVHMRVYGICTVCAELMRVVFRSGGAAYMRAHELTRVVFGRGDTSYTAACACERANARSIWLWRRPLEARINFVYPIIRIVLGTLKVRCYSESSKKEANFRGWATQIPVSYTHLTLPTKA